jgi:hypothetical protein
MGLQLPGQYTANLPLAIEGSKADASPCHVVSAVVEGADVPFGRFMVFDAAGSTDRSVELADADERVLGVSMHSHNQDKAIPLPTGVAQVVTFTVGGTAADGDYVINVDGVDYTVTRSTTPATNDDIAAAFRALLAADTGFTADFAVGGATDAVIVTKNVAGSFSYGSSAPGTGTLVAALTTGGEADGVKQNEEFNLLRKGTIWMRPEDAVTPASGVHMRITANAGVGTALGAARGTADGGNTVDLSAFARWVTSSEGGRAGGLAKLEINLD